MFCTECHDKPKLIAKLYAWIDGIAKNEFRLLWKCKISIVFQSIIENSLFVVQMVNTETDFLNMLLDSR